MIDYEKEARELQAGWLHAESPVLPLRKFAEPWLRSFAARVLREAAKDKFEHMRPTEPFPDGGCFAMCGACRLEKRASEIESGGR